jgi:hypothetical protein
MATRAPLAPNTSSQQQVEASKGIHLLITYNGLCERLVLAESLRSQCCGASSCIANRFGRGAFSYCSRKIGTSRDVEQKKIQTMKDSCGKYEQGGFKKIAHENHKAGKHSYPLLLA